MKRSAEEGMEKRGVVAYGWTPPLGSRVDTTKGRALRDCNKTAAGDLDALDDDFMKRASEAARTKKTK